MNKLFFILLLTVLLIACAPGDDEAHKTKESRETEEVEGPDTTGDAEATGVTEAESEIVEIETFREYPLSDVFVSSYHSDYNYSDDAYNSIEHLYVAYHDPNDSFTERFRTLIYFDTCSIPHMSEIISADLELFTSDYIVGTPRIQIQKINEMWDGETVTWDTQPQYSESFIETKKLAVNQLYSFNVMDLISNDCSFNNGFILTGLNMGHLIRFHSSEVENIEHRPKLIIRYFAGN